ncbi:MAG: ATP-binding protein [Candidatus Omnitrophota bacterium]
MKKKIRFVFLRSIRTRLIAGYTLVLLISIFLLYAYFYLQINSMLDTAAKKYLKSELDTTIDLILDSGYTRADLSNLLSKQTILQKGPYKISYALFNGDGLLLARSGNFFEDQKSVEAAQKSLSPDAKLLEDGVSRGTGRKNVLLAAGVLRNPYEKVFLLQFEEVFHRYFKRDPASDVIEHSMRNAGGKKVLLTTQAFRNNDGNVYYLQFGLDSPGNRQAMLILSKVVFFATPAIFIVALTGGIFLTNGILSQISGLRKAAGELLSPDKKALLPVRGTGDELDELAEAFNAVFMQREEAYQRIVGFTADASHELRLPITAIKGEAEVILERERRIEEYQKVLGSIIEEFDRLTKMINRLLLLTRADSGEDKPVFEEVDLKDMIFRLVEFYKALAELKNISFTFETNEKEARIRADSLKLPELFSNLIENAIKYTPENGQIKISLFKMPGRYEINITDTGIGIPQEEQGKVFERFYRVDKARSRGEGGAGLGLSIAEMIARAHNGAITLKSAPNEGSCFTVMLPG